MRILAEKADAGSKLDFPLSERKNNSNCNLMTYLIAKGLYLVFWDGLVIV